MLYEFNTINCSEPEQTHVILHFTTRWVPIIIVTAILSLFAEYIVYISHTLDDTV